MLGEIHVHGSHQNKKPYKNDYAVGPWTAMMCFVSQCKQASLHCCREFNLCVEGQGRATLLSQTKDFKIEK